MAGSSFRNRLWVCGAVTVMGGIVSFPTAAPAQVVADPSIGTIVTPNGTLFQITNGTTVGGNLFHSFSRFDVPTGGVANFLNNPNIVNIFSRVTGGTPSQIDGIVRSAGTANLFLMNPSGIVFGQNARLDVGGSFVATTANAIQFGDQGNFSATPGNGVSLLTINPSAYLFNQVPTGSIVNRSITPFLPGLPFLIGLKVPDGKNLTLLGGAVALEGGVLSAWGGRMEIGAVAGTGKVDILPTGQLAFAPEVVRGNVTLTKGAQAVVMKDNGGDLGITAADIHLTEGSFIQAGIDTLGGTAVSRAGDVQLDATGTIRVEQGSVIQNFVYPTTTGSAGKVQITADVLEVTGGSKLLVDTAGSGDAGDILLQVRDRVLFQNSVITSSVETAGRGNGGTIAIAAGNLDVRDGTQLLTNTQGNGDAGNIVVNVRDRFLFQNSFASSSVETTGRGSGGTIKIGSNTVEVSDNAQIVSGTSGQGNGGKIVINARDRALFQNSLIFSSVGITGSGAGGNVEIASSHVEVRDGSQLIAATSGQGNAGNIVINAQEGVLFQNQSAAFSNVGTTGRGTGGNVTISSGNVEVRDGAQLVTATNGIGDAGNVQINARDRVLFQGTNANGSVASSAFSSVETTGSGQGGNVEISADSVEVRGGAQLVAASQGRGDAGNVQINASDRLLLDGSSSATGRSSAIFTSNGTANVSVGTGRGGTVSLITRQLTVANGAVIDARTANNQAGGDINLTLDQLNLLTGGQISTNSDSSGTAGTITLVASDQIRISGTDPTYAARLAQFGTAVSPVTANSGLYVRSTSIGAAGNIMLTTPRLTLDQQGRMDGQSTTVSGGNLFLTVPSLLLLRNGSQISATAGTANPQAPGNGGNININARFIVAISNENSDITANATKGRGGNVFITSQGIFGLQFRPQLTSFSDITASSDFGVSGIVNLNTPDNSVIQNSLTQLAQSLINPNTLLANSCIVRSRQQSGSFLITGSGGLPMRPGDAPSASFPTGEVRSLPNSQNQSNRPWKPGDAIVEPQGIYRLPNGKLVMSRECQTQ